MSTGVNTSDNVFTICRKYTLLVTVLLDLVLVLWFVVCGVYKDSGKGGARNILDHSWQELTNW